MVLSVLRGELSAAAAGRRARVSEQTVHNWKRPFLGAGREGLAQGRPARAPRARWSLVAAPVTPLLDARGVIGETQDGQDERSTN